MGFILWKAKKEVKLLTLGDYCDIIAIYYYLHFRRKSYAEICFL